MRTLGIVLVLAGFIGLLWGGIPYKKKETVAEVGGLKMEVTEKKQMSVPPWISGIVILAGAALIMRGGKSAV
jgi:Na+/proline symporter